MKVLFLTVLFLCSCTKYGTMTKDDLGTRISDISMDITQLHEIEWPVGLKKEAVVTQSVILTVSMPRVKEEDLDHLKELKGVNAWILRLVAMKGSERQDLGSMYALFKPEKAIRGQSGAGPTNVSLKIYYAAAYASERFRTFKCPAFGHHKKIKTMTVRGEDKPFEIMIGQTVSYPEKSQKIELNPSSFNGGNSLAG
jgi:hypothetical protein